MSNERLNAIIQMIPGWKETDSYEEDLEKTEIIQELLAELQQSVCQNSDATAIENGYGIENRNGV
jgi:hypothetical protein